MVKQLQAFRIDQGICQFDFSDYYAVLGIPVTADATQVRKRYLNIAKKLHPDVYGLTPAEKEKASHYLSKLINPAYQVLNQERERSEYSAMLKLLAKRLIKRQQKIVPKSEMAEKLLRVPNSFSYEQAVLEIAKMQYNHLDMILDYTGQLSELNLMYLLTKEGYKHVPESTYPVVTPKIGHSVSSQAPKSNLGNKDEDQTVIQSTPKSNYSGSYGRTTTSSSSSNSGAAAAANQNAKPSGGVSPAQEYIRKAEAYITQKQWAQALKELRSGIQADSTNSRCHALMGFVYLHQKLAGLAKSSFQQALKLNPKEPLALKYIDRVSNTATQNSSTQATSSQAKPKDQPKKGGFFGLFGGN